MKIKRWFGKISATLAVLVLSLTMLAGCSSEDVLYLVEALLSETTTEEYYDDSNDYEFDDEDIETEGYETEAETDEADLEYDTTEEDTYEETTEAEEITEEITTEEKTTEAAPVIDKNGRYTSKEDVALYIHTYGKLPSNFITKRDAQELGWESREGNLWEVTDRMSIGGDKFGNYEEILPTKKGRKYYECDINYNGGYRGDERIVFSNDGLIFYTDDHYETFEQLY